MISIKNKQMINYKFITTTFIFLKDTYILYFSYSKSCEKFSTYFVRSNPTNSYNSQKSQIQYLAFFGIKNSFFFK